QLKNRKLESIYLCCYVVSQEVEFKNGNNIERKEITILYGSTLTGRRDILGIYLERLDDNKFWIDTFEQIKSRNVNKIFFMVTKSNKNLERGMKIVYNDTIIINSAYEIITKISNYLPYSKKYRFDLAFKKLFLEESLDNYEIEIQLFKENFNENKMILFLFERNEKIIREFYKYSQNTRKLFLAYYAIRDLKYNIVNTTKKIEALDSLETFVNNFVGTINSFETGKSHIKAEWNNIINELLLMNNGVEKYL
ncbi:MAG: transposase, partial [Bacilli bacterium]